MALKTLLGVDKINGETIVCMDDLRIKFPEKFNESGSMDYKWFEKDIRPHNFIYVRHDVNSLSFTLQNGPIKEVGKNGCQVTDIIAVALHIVKGLNDEFPSEYNLGTIANLEKAIYWQTQRTKDREQRGVEGQSKE